MVPLCGLTVSLIFLGADFTAHGPTVGASSGGGSHILSQDHGVQSHTHAMPPKIQLNGASTDSPSVPPTTTLTAVSSKTGSEAPTPSAQQSRNSSPSSNLGAPPTDPEANTKAPGTAASTSQPMAKTSSSSSASITADAKDAAATGPSPYGTRSRNRTGRSRINYAEDKDLDMTDFDSVAERKGDADPKKIRPALANAPTTSNDGPPRPSASSARKPLPTSDGGKPTSSVKEQHPHNHAGAAASSSSAASSTAATQQISKKRKAGTNAGPQNTKDSPSNSAVVQKPSSVQIEHLGPTGFSETNMMSFDSSEALTTKNNTLIADDGTVLAVNGEHIFPSPDLLKLLFGIPKFC